jgi:hypothetical protein
LHDLKLAGVLTAKKFVHICNKIRDFAVFVPSKNMSTMTNQLIFPNKSASFLGPFQNFPLLFETLRFFQFKFLWISSNLTPARREFFAH